MKRSMLVVPSMLSFALLYGCAEKQPPPELVDARAAYARAQSGPAAQNNRAGVQDAQQALDHAEKKFNDDPDSTEVKTLSYVAKRKSEIAEADSRRELARSQQEQAERSILQMQSMQAQKEAEKERQSAAMSQRRAKMALDKLGLEAKEEPRGTVVTLQGDGMFATNKADILPSAKKRLTEIAQAINQVVSESPQEAGRKIRIIGYTDSTGSDKHNNELSEKRAESVRKFFAEKGVDSGTMMPEGKGEMDPIADNSTMEGRAKNRRVEIVIAPPGGSGMSSTMPTPAPSDTSSKAKGSTNTPPKGGTETMPKGGTQTTKPKGGSQTAPPTDQMK